MTKASGMLADKCRASCEEEVCEEAICDVKNQLNPEIRSPNPEIGADQERIVKHILCKLTAFDAAIKASKLLEIDGLAIGGLACEETTKESKIKVLNSHNEAAYEVSVDAIVRQPLQDLILALETGLFMRLHGVTRIVGYYSRINNWNKSKIGELHDRHSGDYAVGKPTPNPSQEGNRRD